MYVCPAHPASPIESCHVTGRGRAILLHYFVSRVHFRSYWHFLGICLDSHIHLLLSCSCLYYSRTEVRILYNPSVYRCPRFPASYPYGLCFLLGTWRGRNGLPHGTPYEHFSVLCISLALCKAVYICCKRTASAPDYTLLLRFCAPLSLLVWEGGTYLHTKHPSPITRRSWLVQVGAFGREAPLMLVNVTVWPN